MKTVIALSVVAGWATAMRPSPGCGLTNNHPTNQLFQHDPVTSGSSTLRAFQVYIPNSYDRNTPMPLMLSLHGQYGSSSKPCNTPVVGGSQNYPIIGVFPQGLNDRTQGNCGTGWNTGPNGHSADTCNNNAGTCCYESCRNQGVCTSDSPATSGAKCGWSTCDDDIGLLLTLIDTVGSELCVDLDNLFITGYSNGGMLAHGAYQDTRVAGTFKAVIPVCGNPLTDGVSPIVPNGNLHTSALMIHSRNDGVIPDEGGNGGGWFYTSTNENAAEWAQLNGCASSSTEISEFDDYASPNNQMSCREWLGCNGGARVVKCLVNGGHCAVPSDEERLVWSFIAPLFNETKA